MRKLSEMTVTKIICLSLFCTALKYTAQSTKQCFSVKLPELLQCFFRESNKLCSSKKLGCKGM